MNTSNRDTRVRAHRILTLRSAFVAVGATVAIVLGSTLVSSPAFAAEAVSALPAPVSPAPVLEALPDRTHPLTLPSDTAEGSGSATTSPGTQSPQSMQPQGKSAASSSASISGQILNDSGVEGVAGVTVSAVLFDDDYNVKFRSDVTADENGVFSITGLAPADYWILITDASVSGQPTHAWYGGDIMNPTGSTVTVADGEQKHITWDLSATGAVQGNVTCEGCTSAPAPATTVVIFGLPDSTKPGYYKPVAQADSYSASGAYAIDGLYPNTQGEPQYLAWVINDGGPATFAAQSAAPDFTLAPNTLVNVNINMRLLINPIPGLDDQYAQVGNAVVNALYTDFLGRKPAVSEASGWVQQLYDGADPSVVTSGFVNSDEYRLIRIDAAYQSILNRASEPGGRQNWLNAMRGGAITTDQIETSLYASQEYFLAHGGTNTSFAKALYSALLHRPGTESDWSFWAKLASQHGRDWVIAQFWDSQETISERVSLMYQTYLGRVPDAPGLQGWVNVALIIGDSGLRAGLTSSQEYVVRATYRFAEA